jgi:hypothetical protein
MEGARQLALTEMTPGELAARAALWGDWESALAQAQFVLRASPSDEDARVTLLVAQSSPSAQLTSRLSPWEARGFNELSPTAIVLLYQHLRRIAGTEAARHFLRQHEHVMRKAQDEFLQRLVAVAFTD